MKEDVYKEIFKAWMEKIDYFYIAVYIREDLNKLIMVEAMKDVDIEILEYLNSANEKVKNSGIEERLI